MLRRSHTSAVGFQSLAPAQYPIPAGIPQGQSWPFARSCNNTGGFRYSDLRDYSSSRSPYRVRGAAVRRRPRFSFFFSSASFCIRPSAAPLLKSWNLRTVMLWDIRLPETVQTESEQTADAASVRKSVTSEIPDVELRNVTVKYKGKTVLDQVNLSIPRGQSVALIGPSGTGKSTTIKLLCGLELPHSGNVIVRGWTRKKSLEHEFGETKIATVFQNAALFDSMSVAENVGIQLLELSNLPKDRIAELVAQALRRVGLSEDIMDLHPQQLSGGMQKRVSLARSVIYDPDDTTGMCRAPELLLLDEPTAGLDPVISTQIENFVRDLQEVCPTCVIVTHQFSTVRRTADRVVFLYDGKVRWDGLVSEIDDSDNPYVKQFFSASLTGPMEFENDISVSP